MIGRAHMSRLVSRVHAAFLSMPVLRPIRFPLRRRLRASFLQLVVQVPRQAIRQPREHARVRRRDTQCGTRQSSAPVPTAQKSNLCDVTGDRCAQLEERDEMERELEMLKKQIESNLPPSPARKG